MTRFAAISLNNPATIRGILAKIKRSSGLRQQLFKEIARNPKLQNEVLSNLAKHPEAQRRIVLELARGNRVRKWLVKLAGSRTR